jgi:hypothetical protein
VRGRSRVGALSEQVELRRKQSGTVNKIFAGEHSAKGIGGSSVEDLLPILSSRGSKDFCERFSRIVDIS